MHLPIYLPTTNLTTYTYLARRIYHPTCTSLPSYTHLSTYTYVPIYIPTYLPTTLYLHPYMYHVSTAQIILTITYPCQGLQLLTYNGIGLLDVRVA